MIDKFSRERRSRKRQVKNLQLSYRKQSLNEKLREKREWCLAKPFILTDPLFYDNFFFIT